MKLSLWVVLIMVPTWLLSQNTIPNLIENPGFENTDLKDTKVRFHGHAASSPQEFERRCPPWLALRKRVVPEITDSVLRHWDNNKLVSKRLLARNGRQFVSLILHGCCCLHEGTCMNVLGQKFKNPLKKGKIYKLELDAARDSFVAINKIGFLFTQNLINEDDKTVRLVPQLVYDSIVCKVPMAWYRLSILFQLDKDASYMYLGNFAAPTQYLKIYQAEMAINNTDVESKSLGFYYFDNFSLTEVVNPLTVNELATLSKPPRAILSDVQHSVVIGAKPSASQTTERPAHKMPQISPPKEKIVLNNVLFKTNSADLRAVDIPILEVLLPKLLANPKWTLLITGHTDKVGNPAQNQLLSEKRAYAIAHYLQQKGMDAKRIQTKGVGAMQPIGNNETNEGREKNRRVEIEIIDNQ